MEDKKMPIFAIDPEISADELYSILKKFIPYGTVVDLYKMLQADIDGLVLGEFNAVVNKYSGCECAEEN